MDQERLDKILNILKSEDILKARVNFCLKYGIDEASIYPCFNIFFGEQKWA